MQKVIKAAKGGDRNRSYLRLPIKPKGANNATAANSKSEADEKKDDSKSKNKVNVSGVKSKIDTGNHQKEGQVAQQKAATVADEDGKATKPVKKLKKKKSSRESIAAAQPKAVNTADTSQKVVKKVNTANTSQKVVKKVKSKVTSKEGATKTTVKKKKKQAAA